MAGMAWPVPPACPAPAFPAPFCPNAPLVPPQSMAPILPSSAALASRAAFETGHRDAGPAPPAWSADGDGKEESLAVSISRSTSAGSTTPRSSCDESPGLLSLRSTPLASASSSDCLRSFGSGVAANLPEQETVPFVVYNTFINTVPELDELLDLKGFFEQRRVKSCPASPYRDSVGKPVEEMLRESAPKAAAQQAAELHMPIRVLRLAESLQDERPSSPDLPSAGSEGHAQGLCKPCAFVHTKGCGNGPNCEFCHICDAGARKRRQKERMNRWRDAACPDEMPWTEMA